MASSLHMLGRWGRAVRSPHGHHDGWFVMFEEAAGGGYVVMLARDPSRTDVQGVEQYAYDDRDLEGQMAGWAIEWPAP